MKDGKVKDEKNKDDKMKKENPIPPSAADNNLTSKLEPNSTTATAAEQSTNMAAQNSATANPQHSTTTQTQTTATQQASTTNQQSTTDSTQQTSTTNQQKENKVEMKNEQKETTEQTETPTAPMTPKDRIAEANHIVKNRMIASVGAGLIPFPIVDIVALTGIQMDTVRALCKLYSVKFSKDVGKTAVTSLTGGVVPVATGPWVSSLAKSIPVVGPIMGALSMPVIAGASTYAVGQVFIQHFESGGTFLTFDPEKVKGYFQEEFEKGKEFAKAEAKVS